MTTNPHVHENLKAIQKALSNYDMSFLSDDEEDFCPLCLEPMDITDKNFKPCPCGYQICQFCYNNIRQNEELNGRCPACRRKYDDESVEYVVLTTEELKMEREKQARKEWERKQRDKERKEYENANRKHLAGMRVIQKNLVYVVGINPPVPYEEVAPLLKSDKYFGQYGKINKIVVNKKTPHSSSDHYHSNSTFPGYGVYITFSKKEDAAKCIAQVDGTYMDGRLVKAAYGTTKYCSSYLRGLTCPNPNCMFLHEPGEEADSFNRRELSNKQQAQQVTGQSQQPQQTHQPQQTAKTHTTSSIYKNTVGASSATTGHYSSTPSPALIKTQLHHQDNHVNNSGGSTPVLTPAPVPTGSNPWGVSQTANQVSISKNASTHNLPTLTNSLNHQHSNTNSVPNSANIANVSTEHSANKKKQHSANEKPTVDPYDALNGAVKFLDERMAALSNYRTRKLSLKSNLIDDATYKKYPSLFSWDNIEVSKESDHTLTEKLIDVLAINPVDHTASVVSFLQNANVSGANQPLQPMPQTISQQAQAQAQAQAHLQQQQVQRPLNVDTPPPPGMFTSQPIPIQLQQQQQSMADNRQATNSTDFLNQLINGRRVTAGN